MNHESSFLVILAFSSIWADTLGKHEIISTFIRENRYWCKNIFLMKKNEMKLMTRKFIISIQQKNRIVKGADTLDCDSGPDKTVWISKVNNKILESPNSYHPSLPSRLRFDWSTRLAAHDIFVFFFAWSSHFFTSHFLNSHRFLARGRWRC